MAQCIQCGGTAHYHVQLMKVRTYQNPQLCEQEPVQVVDQTVEMDVCQDCAQRQLRGNLHLLDAKEWLQLLIVASMAALCLWVYNSGRNAGMLPGAAACLVLGIGYTLREAWMRHLEYTSLSEREELEKASCEVAISCAERDKERDVTYIPITEQTRKLRSDDLMIDFDLQPETSDRVWNLLHPTQTGSCAKC